MESTIDLILNKYLETRQTEIFKQNPIQQVITHTLKARFLETAHIDTQKYLVKGSAGQGTWANVPWLGVFDRDISTATNEGYDNIHCYGYKYGLFIVINYDHFYKAEYFFMGMNSTIKRKYFFYLLKGEDNV